MKVLFLAMTKINSLDGRGIYLDLLNYFKKQGHELFILFPNERRFNSKSILCKDNGVTFISVKTLNLQKSNVIEKGIGQFLLEFQYLRVIKKYFKNQKFDLILYSTPPISFVKVINYIKRRDNAYSYLLLKDIFPQNAIDMNMIKEKGFLHRIFLQKEKDLYNISDTIGCMSEANKTYVLNNNVEVNASKVEVNPNTILPVSFSYSRKERDATRKKYNLPLQKKIFIYGGNLGVPQGINFLLNTINATKEEEVFFLIVGSGTQFKKILDWFKIKKPTNAKLLSGLSKENYDKLLAVCDVGMIFLNKNFTIPNFPSRLLSYLEMSMPVIASTDLNTDIGTIIEKAECGFWIESGDINSLQKAILKICSNKELFKKMKENSRYLLNSKYTVDKSYNLIMEKLTNININ
jgi:glycosyltransferase involved in cell wall biosynthesis